MFTEGGAWGADEPTAHGVSPVVGNTKFRMSVSRIGSSVALSINGSPTALGVTLDGVITEVGFR